MKNWNHFKTVTYHKFLVLKGCWSVGLMMQGICHDLSKYSWTEFRVGAMYFQGNRSPNNAEREDIGYSTAWMHHKGRNKHHYEYWMDYGIQGKKVGIIPVPMPTKYIVEMLMDRIAACKVYEKEKYQDDSPLRYYMRSREVNPLHEKTQFMLELLLTMMAEKGQKETFRFIRQVLLKERRTLDEPDGWKILQKSS
ncbi:MAG: DUF5662 family protein [Eubacteriales bacterium]